MSFPISTRDYRAYEQPWQGDVFICDIDRTYLATRFSSMRGLARVPFEWSIDKRSIAGMAALLREVRRGPDQRSRHTPIYFISASPAQLRTVIERKMTLDGLEFDGITFKDWTRVVLGGKLARLREQIGFKLTALLERRLTLPSQAQEFLIGDDLESDAISYCLYADTLAGRLTSEELRATLRQLGVDRADIDAITALVEKVGTGSQAAVKRVYIRLERYYAKPSEFLDFSPQLAACRSALQLAIAMMDDNSMSALSVTRVAESLLREGVPPQQLSSDAFDAIKRMLVKADKHTAVRGALASAGIDVEDEIASDPTWVDAMTQSTTGAWTPARFRAH